MLKYSSNNSNKIMNRTLFNILLPSFLCLILIYQALVIKNISNISRAQEHESSKQLHNINTLKKMLTDEWHLEGAQFANKTVVDEDGKCIQIENIALDKPILIFRFSKVDCSKCVIEQIDIIKELIKTRNIDYMMVCDYNNQRNLGLFKRINEINNKVYDCEKLLEGEEKTPFFFIYHKGYVSNVFFPDDDFADLTKSYLNSISKKYF